MEPTWRNALRIWSTLLVVAAFAVPALAQEVCITFVEDDWEEGFCDVCGEGVPAYECASFAGWSDGLVDFADPVPAGRIVTRINATMTGLWGCSGPTATIRTEVEGEPIETKVTPAGGCACGSCDAVFVTNSPTFTVASGGWPGYNYGGSNNFNAFVLAGNVCANSLTLEICHESADPLLPLLAFLESKLDDEVRFTDDSELALIESKLDDEARFTDDTELTNAQNNINANVDAAETSINANVDAAETNIRADVALIESKLDVDVAGALVNIESKLDDDMAIVNLESKLDDEARFTDDTELAAVESSINTNVDAAESSINANIDTAETNIRADVALIESKLDDIGMDALTNLESKLDDETRFTDDTEYQAGIDSVNTNVDAAETSINANVDTAETNIRADVALIESKLDAIDMAGLTNLESKLDDEARFTDNTELIAATASVNANVDAAESAIRGDVALIESKLDDIGMDGLANLESKLDDEARFTDNTELIAAYNLINANVDAAETAIINNDNTNTSNIRGDISLVESKLDDIGMASLLNLESKLDDEARFTDDTELTAVESSINTNVDAAESSINANIDTAETNIRADVALVESKLDDIGMDALTNLESKLDDEARFTDDTEYQAGIDSVHTNVDAAETSINANVDTAETNIRADVALIESKLDVDITGALVNIESKLDDDIDITNLESKLDDEARFTDDTEYQAGIDSVNTNVDAAETSINANVDAAESSINANVDAAESSINANIDTAETNIRADVALIESKLDVDVTSALINIESKLDDDMDLVNLESKLDDEARFTDDTEFQTGVDSVNTNVDAAESSINANVDAAESSINANIDTAETNIRADVALIESKLDVDVTDALVNVESKLDDESRYTDDTEFQAGVDSINANVDAAESSINANVDAAESSINSNVDQAEANIRADVALLESKLDVDVTDALVNVESKLDDESQYTDDTELSAQTTTIVTEINENENILNDAKMEIMLLESKLDDLDLQVSQSLCIVIDLLLTPERERCTDSAECGFGVFPTGLESVLEPAACMTASSQNVPFAGGDSRGSVADVSSQRDEVATRRDVVGASPALDLSAVESLLAEANSAAQGARRQTRAFISEVLRSEELDPLLLLSLDQGGLFEEVAELVRASLALYRDIGVDPAELFKAEAAFREAEQMRAEGIRPGAYRGYRAAYRQLLAMSTQLK